MKKLFNLFSIIYICSLLCLLTGCGGYFSGEKPSDVVLKEAIEELNEESYTVTSDMYVEMRVESGGQVVSEKTNSFTKIESDGTRTYAEIIAEGIKSYQYTEINDDKVDLYTLFDGNWLLVDSIDLNEYKENDHQVFEIDTKNCFKLEDGIYIGNVEKINEQLKEYMQQFSEQFAGSGLTMTESSVEKYDITLENNKVSKIDIIMNVEMSMDTVVMKIRVTMPMVFSNIGETTVTNPIN